MLSKDPARMAQALRKASPSASLFSMFSMSLSKLNQQMLFQVPLCMMTAYLYFHAIG